MDEFEIIPQEEVDEIRSMIEETGVKHFHDYLKMKASQWKDVEIHIAISGETYVGKSTFINQLRGVEEYDDRYAPVGFGDTTTVPTPYENPYNTNLVIWDLPGFGTLKFPKDGKYFDIIQADKYDFFIIMSDQCFSENDAWVAREIRKRGKPFFFVRSKLDEAIGSAENDGCNVQEIVPRIYQSCRDNLRKANIREPKLFIMSNYDHEIGQFDELMSSIFETLPDLKRTAMILSVAPLTHQIIREKKRSLYERVFKIGLISAGAAAVPIPGFDVLVDLAIIVKEIHFYMEEFGLDEESIRHLCKKIKTKYDQVVKSLNHAKYLLGEKETVRALFMKIVKSQAAEQATGKFAKYIPVIGSVVSSVIAYGACVYFLKQEIDLLAEDAHTLIEIVIEKNKNMQ